MCDFLIDPRYKAWLARVKKSGTTVRSVQLLATVQRGSNTFAGLVDTELVTAGGQVMHRCMMIRGDSVIVVPVIHPSDGSPPYTLMVDQHRPVDGCHTLEFVAGMIESDESAETCAVNEVKEELGLTIDPSQLHLLHQEPIRVCTAMLDERAYAFMFFLEVAESFRQEIDGASTGDHSDGERIRVRAVDFSCVGDQPTFSAQVGLRLTESFLGHRFWENQVLQQSDLFHQAIKVL